MKVNDQVKCVITGIQPYGLFVECNQKQGLIHISEISDLFVSELADIFSVDDLIEATIIEIDDAEERLKLSYKKAHPIDQKISKYIRIKKGFHPLSKALPSWIKEKKEK